jgi:hypothetical protein
MKISSIKSRILHSTGDIKDCLEKIVTSYDFIESIYIKNTNNEAISPIILSPYIWVDKSFCSLVTKSFNRVMKSYFSKLKTGIQGFSITEPFISPFTESMCYTVSCKLNDSCTLCINIEDFSDKSCLNLNAV